MSSHMNFSGSRLFRINMRVFTFGHLLWKHDFNILMLSRINQKNHKLVENLEDLIYKKIMC